MKLVIAYIQPDKLNDVKRELYKADVCKMSVTNALGCGQQMGYHESYRGVDVEVNLLKKVRLEIAVNADFVEPTIEAIIERTDGVPLFVEELTKAMIESGSHMVVMAYNEFTTDVPEHARLEPAVYWDRRARGLGATPEAPAVMT